MLVKQELIDMFEEATERFGAKKLSNMLCITRATLLNYRKGKFEDIPYSIVMRTLYFLNKKDKGIKLYGVRQNIKKTIGRPKKV